MNKKIPRRSFLKGFLSFAAAGFTLSAGGYGYARFLEPRLLDIQPLNIVSKKIQPAFDGLKIVQFSDTHLSKHYSLNQLKKIITAINGHSPDLVFFTGDLIDDPLHYKEGRQVILHLSGIKAALGKYAVYGNHDHGGYGTGLYQEIMAQSGFRLLKNESARVSLVDGSFIHVAGLDDLILGRPDYKKTAAMGSRSEFTILLAHEPDAWLEAKKYDFDLQLSGHSHGGQIQLPFYGPLITPPYADVYTEGMYTSGEKNLYVNRGLGTTRLPFRFLSVPEITVITLMKGK
ncbi:metallophosphoesterase [Bacillus mangrovi]|uniref:Metallophosphoesterase n=1 Tax=Metabacillus mangrovi TaxID=1491830 RepID=A0A7X2S5D4_9BACI|nr:metallophosphoesterase [Metabacillus mangrovi]MTH53106.1 metallophosphoesterase [Metabacillus mangrovi]